MSEQDQKYTVGSVYHDQEGVLLTCVREQGIFMAFGLGHGLTVDMLDPKDLPLVEFIDQGGNVLSDKVPYPDGSVFRKPNEDS